jgi:hypothetical protein
MALAKQVGRTVPVSRGFAWFALFDANKIQNIFLGTTVTAEQGALIDDIYIAQDVNLQLPKPLQPPDSTMVRFY